MCRLDEFVHHEESKLREQLSHPQFTLLIAVLEDLEHAEGIGADDEVTNNHYSEQRS